MKKHIISAVISSIVLLVFAYLCLLVMPLLLPDLVEDYYNPAFVNDSSRNMWYFVQPVVISFGLAWFWNNFKASFKGNWVLKGLELGVVYALIATLPAMILLFSAIDIPLKTVGTWFLYGFMQAFIVGEISARIDP